MKNYMDSDYAANKKAEGIVYRFVTEPLELTLEAYLAENPDKTEVDFAELKALSDSDYFERDRGDCRQTWKNVSLDKVGELADCAAPDPEDEVISKPEQAAIQKRRYALGWQALNKLTKVQRRRYVMYHAHGMTTREIGKKESVQQRTVMDSLEWAEKKIKKLRKTAKNDLSKP